MAVGGNTSRIEIFCCYAREDQHLLQELKSYLMPLQRGGLITLWADTDIHAGVAWEEGIHHHLNTAQIILLLISPDFLASDYCYSIEMKRALERHERGEAVVIPIILRPVFWQGTPFGKLQVLPTDAYPITKWHDHDEAFFGVVNGIRQVIEEISFKGSNVPFRQQLQYEREKRGWTQADLAQKIDVSRVTIQRWEAGEAFPVAHMRRKLATLFGNEELLFALSSSIQKQSPSDMLVSSPPRHLANSNPLVLPVIAAILRPQSPSPWVHWCYTILGRLFLTLKLYKKAITIYEKALLAEPLSSNLHIGKGEALLGLRRSNEALAAYEQAIHLTPNSSVAYEGQGKAFEQLAQQAFDEVTQQAQECYERAKQLGVE